MSRLDLWLKVSFTALLLVLIVYGGVFMLLLLLGLSAVGVAESLEAYYDAGDWVSRLDALLSLGAWALLAFAVLAGLPLLYRAARGLLDSEGGGGCGGQA